MSDPMSRLPVASQQQQPSEQEMRVMEAMFGSTSSGYEAKRLIVPGVLFLVLNLPFIDTLLKGVITASNTVLLLIKTCVFLVSLLVAQLIGWV
jgi:hypothetical protein